MGFYIRKSIKVGPLRFNLSKSGVGISAGVKGFRLGTGPRGNYVHMGLGGLYYRSTLAPKASGESNFPQVVASDAPKIPYGTHAPLQEIESSDVSGMVDSSSEELLAELNEKRRKIRYWPAYAVCFSILFLYGLGSDWSSWLMWPLFVMGGVGLVFLQTKDALRKTAVIFYEFDSEMEAAYQGLHAAASILADCSATWHIEASGAVYDRKYHAGASNLVRRKKTFISRKEPPYVKTNIETVAVGVGRQTLHFFPDRVLVYDVNGVGAVGYKDLVVRTESTRFIEEDGVPNDAEVVGKTWKYVNKSGGPDRRFKDNREIPVCLYDDLELSSGTGLNELLQLSKSGVAVGFSRAISALSGRIKLV